MNFQKLILKFLFIFFLFIPSLAYSQCEVTVDGYCHLDAAVIQYEGIPTADAPAVSNSGQAVQYFDSTLGTLMCSEDGGAFAVCVGGGGTTITFDTVANLPGAPSTNDLAGVTDGADESDCTVGGGTDQNICVYSGSAWVIIGDGQATPASGDSVTVNSVAIDTTANFLDNTVIEFDLADGGPGGPDDITGTITANGVDDTMIDWGDGAGQVDADDVPFPFIAGSTYSTVEDMNTLFHSAGWISGGGITDDGDDTITVAVGTGLIRATDSVTAQILFFDWSAEAGANVNIAADDMSYVYVEYNAGSPQVIATTTKRTDINTNVFLGTVYRDGTLHINARTKNQIGDHALQMVERMKQLDPFARYSGAVLSETGTRNVAVTAGNFWEGLGTFTTDAVDTSAAGTFVYIYQDGVGGWTEVASSTQINNTQYDDGSGTLATLANAKYGVHWVYIEQDHDLTIVYGRGSYSLSEAQDADVPANLPPQFDESHGKLIGKIIILKSASTFTSAESAFETSFQPSVATEHSNLSGLAWNSAGHTGSNSVLSGFNGSGAASEYTLSGTGTEIPTTTSPTFITSIIMGSATLSEAELEILDGATLSTTQINYLNAATGTTGTTSTNVVFSTSPTLITPALGTPSALVGTNITGTGASFTAGTATTANAGDSATSFFSSGTIEAARLPDASVTAEGIVELTTTAEIDTGTDSTRAIPIDQFVASKRNVRWLVFNLVEAGTDTATATNIAGDFVSTIAGTILQSDTTPFYIYATNSTAGTTGTMVVDISINGTSIMTTNKLDFDTTEKTTTTAATPPDLTTTALAVGDIITIDIDAIHTTAAKGLTVYMAVRE